MVGEECKNTLTGSYPLLGQPKIFALSHQKKLNYPRLEGEGYKIWGSTRSRPQVHWLSGVIPAKAGIQDRLRK